MPNYGLIIDSTYNPMSFAEYAAPFEKYAEVYKEMADSYDTLEMEANQWEKLANSAQDVQQYAVYKKYAEDLRNSAEKLYESGLNTKTRGEVSNLRTRFAKEIKPISDAWNLREKEREIQRQALLQNPDIIFSRDASNTGLSAYMNGTPELQTYNGAKLYEYTSKAVEQLAQAAREDLIANGVDSEWYPILGGQYYQRDNYKGVTADVIMQSMFDSNGNIKPEANRYLNTIANGAIDLSGMRNWGNWSEIAPRAYSYVNQGLWGAIGSEEEKQLSNKYFDYALRQDEAARAVSMNQTSIPINPRNIYSRVKRTEAQRQYDEFIKDSPYIKVNSDGTWDIQPVNIEAEIEPGLETTQSRIDHRLIRIFEKEYKKKTGVTFDNSLQAKIYMEQHPKVAGELIKNYFYDQGVGNENNYDATRYTEYNYAYDSEQQKEIKNAILPLLQNTNLQAVDWDDENDTYTTTGDELTAGKLKDATILESNFSVVKGVPYSVISVQHDDGSIGIYKMPAGINRQNELARDQSLIYAEQCRIELKKITENPNTINPRTGNPYTQSEVQTLKAAYDNHIQNAYKGQSQIGLKYKTSNVTIPGYGY